MKKIIIAAVLAAAMALTGCGGEITEKANGALESAQNAAEKRNFPLRAISTDKRAL